MKHPARWLIALALLACVLAWWWNRPPPEPKYRGIPLSQWLKEQPIESLDQPLSPAGLPEVKWLAYTAEHGRSPGDELGVSRRLLEKIRGRPAEPLSIDERQYAIYALGNLGPVAKPAIPVLVRVINGDTYGHVYAAASALHQIGSDSWPVVDDQLAHGSSLTRCALLRTMGSRLAFGSVDDVAKVFNRLTEALHDPEPNIRRNAASSLASAISFASRQSIPGAFVDQAAAGLWLLPDESNKEVREAKQAVQSFYNDTKPEAIPRLTALLSDPDAAKRNFAQAVLEQLEPASKKTGPP